MEDVLKSVEIFGIDKGRQNSLILFECVLCGESDRYKNPDQIHYLFYHHVENCIVWLNKKFSAVKFYWNYDFNSYAMSKYRLKILPVAVVEWMSLKDSVNFDDLYKLYGLTPSYHVYDDIANSRSLFDIPFIYDSKQEFDLNEEIRNKYLLEHSAIVICVLCEMEYSSPPNNEILFAHLAKCKGVRRRL